MIRSRLGRRVGAALVALLLLLNLAAPLVGASANSSNLPSVGWAETVSAFLMSCGIYPFETDENGNYTEWSTASLVPLWNQFREDVTTVSNDIWDMVGYLVNGVVAIASGRWSVLREFASWIVSTFNVTDNQTGVELGVVTGGLLQPHVFTSSPAYADFVQNGTRIGYSGTVPLYAGVSRSEVYFGIFEGWFGCMTLDITAACYFGARGVNSYSVSASYSYGGRQFYYGPVEAAQNYTVFDAIPSYPTLADFASAILSGTGGTLSGVTADTTTVSIPTELPDDTQYGGLTVAGAGAAVTVETLTEIVQEAVIEGLKPIVNTVLVNLSPDIEINPDSGEITQGEITITPADIDLVSTDYQIRQLHTVFPFSIPWDVANVFSALNAEPVRPYWEVSLTLPGILGQPDTQIPFTIGISDDSPLAGPVDTFAALARNFFLVLMCVGTLMLFRKR